MSVSTDKFDALLKIAAVDLVRKDMEYANSLDTSSTVVSEKTLRKVRRRIKNHDKGVWWNELPFACRRAIAAVLIVCTLSFALCMSVEAVREQIVNTVLEWYDKFVAVFYMAEEVKLEKIEEYREPSLQIAGSERMVVSKAELEYSIMYIKDDAIIITYDQRLITDASYDFNSENGCVQENIKINDYKAVLLKYDGLSNLTWHDHEYYYVISLFTEDIDIDTLILIAESVK